MIPNCYFCSNKLEHFDPSYGLPKHLLCRVCPPVEQHSPIIYDIKCRVWSQPYFVLMGDDKIECFFLYFRGLKVWLRYDVMGKYYYNNITIFNANISKILGVSGKIDITNLTTDALENKIKSWILLS